MKTKKISVIVSIVMLLTMVFGAGSVFANGRDQGQPSSRGKFLRLETASYIVTGSNKTLDVAVVAVFENGALRLTPDDCVYEVDHDDVVKVVNGQIITLKKGIATVNVYAYGTSTQMTVEVIA